MAFRVPEEYRVIRDHPVARHLPPHRVTRPRQGRFGAFYLPGPFGVPLLCIASDGSDWQAAGLPGVPWEHVSITTAVRTRCPNWPEMCRVKNAFWEPEDAVMQLHPPASEYVNAHEFCLHLWRPTGIEIPLPPAICVGPKSAAGDQSPSW